MELGTDFFTNCKKALQEAAKQQSNNIAYGGAESFSDYRYACGIVKGFDLSLTIIEEVLERMSKEQK
jgi:hypothetical protein